MKKPTNADEMRLLLLDYIDALLAGSIKGIKLEHEKEEPDAEKLATETGKLMEQIARFSPNEYQVVLTGISILYKENRETATERCYALFWRVQQMKSASEQLSHCYDMLRMLDAASGRSTVGFMPGPFPPLATI